MAAHMRFLGVDDLAPAPAPVPAPAPSIQPDIVDTQSFNTGVCSFMSSFKLRSGAHMMRASGP